MKSTHKTLFVNPLARVSVQGRHNQTYTMRSDNGELIATQSMKKNKEFDCTDRFSFPYNPSTSRLETGLDETISNPLKDKDPLEVISKYNLQKEWQPILDKILEHPEISKQTYFEIISGVKPDFYTSQVNGTMFQSRPNDEHDKPSFLQKFELILYDRPNRFVDDGTKKTARERLCMELIKVHPKIANSKNLANSAYHNWFISEENEAEREFNQRANIVNEGTYKLYKLIHEDNVYRQYQVSVLQINSDRIPIIKGKVSNEKVKEALNRFVTDQSDRNQIKNVNHFLKTVELLDTREGSIRFELEYIIQQAVNTNVIKLVDGYYIWHSKADTPNVYKFSDKEKLITLLEKEYESYNPKDKEITNWYSDLVDELRVKNVWLDE